MLTDLNLFVQYTGTLSLLSKLFLFLVWEINISEFSSYESMIVPSGPF